MTNDLQEREDQLDEILRLTFGTDPSRREANKNQDLLEQRLSKFCEGLPDPQDYCIGVIIGNHNDEAMMPLDERIEFELRNSQCISSATSLASSAYLSGEDEESIDQKGINMPKQVQVSKANKLNIDLSYSVS